jgi:hypothetical protein
LKHTSKLEKGERCGACVFPCGSSTVFGCTVFEYAWLETDGILYCRPGTSRAPCLGTSGSETEGKSILSMFALVLVSTSSFDAEFIALLS